MKSIAIDAIPIQPLDAPPADSIGAASRGALRALFWLARHAPWLLRGFRPLGVHAGVYCCPKVRRAVDANARRIFGAGLTQHERESFAAAVVQNFYDFVVDVGRSRAMSVEQLRAGVETIEGHEAYVAHRKAGRGVIILTAHMGSFEIGLAALAEVEPHIHVVFKRDALGGFENIRRALRRRLNIHEAPIDEGWATWVSLRDALAANHCVVMQGDRVMPGQKFQAVPLLGGTLPLPLGPVKLAQIAGSPIVPVFTIRSRRERYRLFVEKPIHVDPADARGEGVDPTIRAIGKVLEKFIAAYPEQWLVLDPAFLEDAAPAGAAG